MATKVFVDNHLLRGMLSEKRGERADALHQFKKLNHNSYEAVIPQVAVGELVSVAMRDFGSDPTKIHNKLGKLYESIIEVLDVATCMPPPNKKSVLIASELKNRDSNLDVTDLLILSQALNDPESQRFLTTDKKLLDSDVIKQKEEELRSANDRDERLKIVDGL